MCVMGIRLRWRSDRLRLRWMVLMWMGKEASVMRARCIVVIPSLIALLLDVEVGWDGGSGGGRS